MVWMLPPSWTKRRGFSWYLIPLLSAVDIVFVSSPFKMSVFRAHCRFLRLPGFCCHLQLLWLSEPASLSRTASGLFSCIASQVSNSTLFLKLEISCHPQPLIETKIVSQLFAVYPPQILANCGRAMFTIFCSQSFCLNPTETH